MEKLVSLRQDLAEALGFPSYSHLSAWQRVLKEPQDVNAFLEVRDLYLILLLLFAFGAVVGVFREQYDAAFHFEAE